MFWLRRGFIDGDLNTVFVNADAAYCLVMMKQPEIETDSDQPERFNIFAPFGAPGFDMESPLQLRLFDPQVCGELQADWLAYAVESHGITRAELDAMIAGKLLRLRKDGAGREGFLLYTEQQARLANKLQESGRYSEAELQHIFSDWNEFLEVLSVDDLAYDDMSVDDYESFRRRTREMTDFFANDIARIPEGKLSAWSFPCRSVGRYLRSTRLPAGVPLASWSALVPA